MPWTITAGNVIENDGFTLSNAGDILTFDEAGRYLVTFSLMVTNTSTTREIIRIVLPELVFGSLTLGAGYYRGTSLIFSTVISGSGIVNVSAGDVLSLDALGDSNIANANYAFGGSGSHIEIYKMPETGGGGGGTVGRHIRHFPIVTNPIEFTAENTTLAFTAGTHSFHPVTFTAVNPTDVQEINLIIKRLGDTERSVHISRNDFLHIGFADPAPSWAIYSIAGSVIIPAYVLTGNGLTVVDRDDFIRSTYTNAETNRAAGRGAIYIFFIENANNMMEEIQIYANAPSNTATFQLMRADIVLQEDIP